MAGIGIGIVGGGYMGKAHAIAFSAVGAVFDTALRPRLEMVAATSDASAERHRAALGFARAVGGWRALVADPAVEAVVIALPPSSHREIAEAALALGKPVLCEKPLAPSLADAHAMVAAAEAAGVATMTGFNYPRTPATQEARRLLAEGAIGDVVWFRAEHTEDFLADPTAPATWRTQGAANGTMGDLAPHPIDLALSLMGPIERLVAEVETVHAERPGGLVTNDDQAQWMCRFANGAMGQMHASRVHTGRKMGLTYEVVGTRGAIRFDQEDQNALHLYRASGPARGRGFTRILAGPEHGAYAAFCQGAGHGTGYVDQIVIQARDFLHAIHGGEAVRPTFRDGLAVAEVVEAVRASAGSGRWVTVGEAAGRAPGGTKAARDEGPGAALIDPSRAGGTP